MSAMPTRIWQIFRSCFGGQGRRKRSAISHQPSARSSPARSLLVRRASTPNADSHATSSRRASQKLMAGELRLPNHPNFRFQLDTQSLIDLLADVVDQLYGLLRRTAPEVYEVVSMDW